MKNKNDCRQKENWVPWPCPLKAKYGDMGSNFMEIGAVTVNFNGKESPPFVISSRKVYLSFFLYFLKIKAYLFTNSKIFWIPIVWKKFMWLWGCQKVLFFTICKYV